MLNLRKHYQDSEDKLNSFFVRSNRYDIDLYVKKILETDCTACTYDPVRKESTNIACPTCGGKGKIVDVRKAKIPAWFNPDAEEGTIESGGVTKEQNIRVTLSDKTFKHYQNYLKNRTRVYINDSDYEIVMIEKLGVSPYMFVNLRLTKVLEPLDITR
jgi:predicted RNA-binding Zn-ribbon protein involved in translation (DUF1610 family)